MRLEKVRQEYEVNRMIIAHTAELVVQIAVAVVLKILLCALHSQKLPLVCREKSLIKKS
jgi:hypothetical protein